MKYNPHDYQTYATNFVLEHPVAAVLLEMGLGKSVITLTAIFELLYNRFEVGKVLVIAPLRVARDGSLIVKWFFKSGSNSVCFSAGNYERFMGSSFCLYFSANSGLFHLAYKLYRWR